MKESHQFEDATFALHRIRLPLGASILQHLIREDASEASGSACLAFEVFDCFDDKSGIDDMSCLKGTLCVSEILKAANINAAMWEKVLLLLK